MCQTEKMYVFITDIAKEYTQYTAEIYFLHLTIIELVVACYKINCSLDN